MVFVVSVGRGFGVFGVAWGRSMLRRTGLLGAVGVVIGVFDVGLAGLFGVRERLAGRLSYMLLLAHGVGGAGTRETMQHETSTSWSTLRFIYLLLSRVAVHTQAVLDGVLSVFLCHHQRRLF